MDSNNLMPSLPNGEPVVDTGDWRTQLPPGSRQKVINKIMETLKKHISFSGPDGINKLTRIATRFEETIFSSAINETDYLRKIAMKMLTMETKSQNAVGASSTIPAANNGTSLDSTPINQGHLLTGSLPTNQSQTSLSQPMQNNTGSGMIGSTALPSSMPPVSSFTNNNVTSAVNQSSNMQNQSDSSEASFWQKMRDNLLAQAAELRKQSDELRKQGYILYDRADKLRDLAKECEGGESEDPPESW